MGLYNNRFNGMSSLCVDIYTCEALVFIQLLSRFERVIAIEFNMHSFDIIENYNIPREMWLSRATSQYLTTIDNIFIKLVSENIRFCVMLLKNDDTQTGTKFNFRKL